MTSQHDIEIGAGKMRNLVFELKELEKEPKSKLTSKNINKIKNKIDKLNKQMLKWCTEFDFKIKPLPKIEECEHPDKIFVCRVPQNIKDPQPHLKQYEGFIKSQNFKVIGMDKQKGYVYSIFSFYTVKTK